VPKGERDLHPLPLITLLIINIVPGIVFSLKIFTFNRFGLIAKVEPRSGSPAAAHASEYKRGCNLGGMYWKDYFSELLQFPHLIDIEIECEKK
jgi:hypothetical protein